MDDPAWIDRDLLRGREQERRLDKYFTENMGLIVEPTSTVLDGQIQKLGVDRVLSRVNGKPTRVTVEYKSCFRAHETGNAAIEITSVLNGTQNKPGWAWTSCAQLIAYLLAHTGEMYLMETLAMRHRLRTDWEKKYRTAEIPNRNPVTGREYRTVCVLVPLWELRWVTIHKHQLLDGWKPAA